MITAIVNQRIKRRQKGQRLLSAAFPSPPLPEEGPDELAEQTITRFQFIAIFALLLLCSLLLLGIQSNVIPLGRQMWAEINLELPEDFSLREAVVDYTVSGDVRQDQPSESGLTEAVISSLHVSQHIVRNGESVSSLAQRYKLNLDTIISYNDIRNAKSLKTGQRLLVPSIDGLKYKVRRGDSLSRIADKYGIALNTLLDWNNIDSDVIHPGTEYFIPGARLSEYELNLALGILFLYPVKGILSSPFGWRNDPFTGKRRFHNGIDLVNKPNTAIKAAMAGKVVKASYNAVYGRYIIIRHNDGFQSLYGHLESYCVKEKQWVSQGQKIGAMGNTGYSTGTHLHFAIFRNGEPVNPFEYLK